MKKFALSLFLMSASAVSAQDAGQFTVETGLSTLGIMLSPEYAITNNIHVRAPLYLGSLSFSEQFEGNPVDGNLDVKSLSILGDYYFGDSGFRLSAGAAIGGYNLSFDVEDPELNGTTFNADISAEIKQKNRVAPVLAVGYRYAFNDRWGLTSEIGARFAPMEITTSGEEVLSAADQADFRQEIDGINNDLDSFGVIPYISMGISYSF